MKEKWCVIQMLYSRTTLRFFTMVINDIGTKATNFKVVLCTILIEKFGL